MLQTLSKLGFGEEQDVSYLLTPITNVNNVIGIVFENKDSKVTYINSRLSELGDQSNYLFRKMRGGRPGLFLTGTIPRQDIIKINEIDDTEFIRKKILWFPHGKLVSDTNTVLFNTLTDYRMNELIGIFEEFKIENRGRDIAKDVIDLLTGMEPRKTLLTVMIREQGNTQFVGQIDDYVEFFRRGTLASRDNKKNKIDAKEKSQEEGELLVCNICNKQSLIYPFSESPLPFFFSKKTHFFDNTNIAKSFPLCEICYSQLQRGINFVQDNLDYNISSVQLDSNKFVESGINFWLIPTLDNPQFLLKFKGELGSNRLYYLNSLKELCSTLTLISTFDYEKRQDNVESFLRFSALYYTKDRAAFGLMRVLNHVQGIYPEQLQKLLEVKERIDQSYPFQHIRGEQFFIGLPLLVTFYKNIKPQWQSQVISILNRMFTGQQIPIEEIIKNIRIRIRESLRESKDLQIMSRIALMGLMLLEYVTSLNNNNNESMGNSDSNILMLNLSTYEIKHTEKFISSHKSLLSDETRQGIFAAGVTVAILLYVQEDRYGKVGPYWKQLGRLDLDLQKVRGFFHSVKSHLGLYKIRDYDAIINYLAVKYIIDLSSPITKDTISYIFTLGLSFGYMLANKNLKDNGEEEVN
jgi:CRISPR-associated protein Cas8b/Csh1 subtype I-B